MSDLKALSELIIAPYIMKASALIVIQRRVGGNQFRHAFSTLGILLDYKYYNDSVLLKASLIHDLIEDLPLTVIEEIRQIDHDGNKVVDLVMEVTRSEGEIKSDYLQRILDKGSRNALILKCADRISNLTDLHRDTDSDVMISKYLDQTEKYVLPMARRVNEDMMTEITEMIAKRRKILSLMKNNQGNSLNTLQ